MPPRKDFDRAAMEAKFLAGLEPLAWSDCIVWVGTHEIWGYGRIHAGGGSKPAHCYAWERENGPIPRGMVVDHICHNPPCVNVDHLRVVTPAQNTQNRAGAQRNSTTGIRNVRVHEDHWVVEVRGFSATCVYDLDEARALARERRSLAFGPHAGRS